MGNCVHKVDSECYMPNGDKFIRGTFKMADSYATAGDALNLSNYIQNTATCTVVVSSSNGYTLEHDKGLADAGKIKAYYGGVNGLNVLEVLSATNLVAVNVSFFAIGKPY